jgi:hypothetical protein
MTLDLTPLVPELALVALAFLVFALGLVQQGTGGRVAESPSLHGRLPE